MTSDRDFVREVGKRLPLWWLFRDEYRRLARISRLRDVSSDHPPVLTTAEFIRILRAAQSN